MRVLCIAAHPDDEILGVGGTLLRHVAAGDEVTVSLTMKCRRSTDSDEESYVAAERMGIFYGRSYLGDPTDILPVGVRVSVAVNHFKPDIVYTHTLADLHHEHRALHEAVLVACRPESGVKSIYAFETPSATEWGMTPFRPTRYVDIGAHLHQKNVALMAYDSELRPPPHPRNVAGVIKYAQFRGLAAWMEYAEAFEVIREVW